jgi:tryptophan synthase alpha chain
MTYYNLVMRLGHERCAQQLRASGVDGAIVPDLPLEELDGWADAADAAAIETVLLAAPTTPDERLARIGARARGFLYTVSLTGTTGERVALAETFGAVVGRAKAHTSVPVALGFGISTPEHAAQAAAAGADGVIVGSRLVRAAAESADPAAEVGRLVAELAAALRG